MGGYFSDWRFLFRPKFPRHHQLRTIHHSILPSSYHVYGGEGIFEIEKMIEQFGYVAAFLGAGILFLGLILTLARFIRPNRPNVEKNSTYESGEAPVGNANIRFNPRFYVIALLFVLFEIELVFLFPTATLLKDKALSVAAPEFPMYAVFEILLFVGILALGLAFAWVKGYLNWEKPETAAEKLNIPIPDSVYDSIRTKHSGPK